MNDCIEKQFNKSAFQIQIERLFRNLFDLRPVTKQTDIGLQLLIFFKLFCLLNDCVLSIEVNFSNNFSICELSLQGNKKEY